MNVNAVDEVKKTPGADKLDQRTNEMVASMMNPKRNFFGAKGAGPVTDGWNSAANDQKTMGGRR